MVFPVYVKNTHTLKYVILDWFTLLVYIVYIGTKQLAGCSSQC